MAVAIAKEATPECAPTCTEWIAAQGKIDAGTAAAFDRVLRSLGKRRLPVFIDSPGGSVETAMAIGRQLRAKHLDVVVTRTLFTPCVGSARQCRAAERSGRTGQPRGLGAVCASACVLVLAAGEKRGATPGAIVGVHQMLVDRTLVRKQRIFRVLTRVVDGVKVEVSRTLVQERVVSTTHLTVKPAQGLYDEVGAYLARMGIGAGLIPLMLATPPTGLHPLTREEERATGIVTEAIDGETILREARAARPATAGVPNGDASETALLALGGAPPRVGRVTWSLDQSGSTTPDGAELRAVADFPDAGFKLSLSLSRVVVAGLAPVVVMDVFATRAPGSAVHAITMFSPLQVKRPNGQANLTPPSTVDKRGADAYQIRFGADFTGVSATTSLAAGSALAFFMRTDDSRAATITLPYGATGTSLLSKLIAGWDGQQRSSQKQSTAP